MLLGCSTGNPTSDPDSFVELTRRGVTLFIAEIILEPRFVAARRTLLEGRGGRRATVAKVVP